MKAILAIALMVALAFAGCASKDTTSSSSTTPSTSTTAATTSHTTTTTTTATSTSSATTTTGTTSPTTTAPPANTPPTVGLTVSAANGTAPLNVTFSLTGSDSDGDTVHYNLTFGDGSAAVAGSQLPTTVTHQYILTGNFTAALVASDGHYTVNATALVKVHLKGAAGPQVVTGTWTAGVAGCPEFDGQVITTLNSKGVPPTGYPSGTPLAGKEWMEFPVRADTIGGPFTVKFTQTTPSDPSGVLVTGAELAFFNNKGSYISNYQDGATGNMAGNVDAGAALGVIFPCGTGPGSFTYTAG